MEKKDTPIAHENKWLKDLTDLKSDAVPHFAPEQMVECKRCSRPNPPTKPNCFYCGEKLEISEKNENFVRPNFRELEDWEKGFNVACFAEPETDLSQTELQEISTFLEIETKILAEIIGFGFPLPVRRVETHSDAEIIEKRLAKYNLPIGVFADADLSPEKAPSRIRAVEFGADFKFRLNGTDEVKTLNSNDLIVFVEGRIFERKREAVEKRGKKGEAATEIGEAVELSDDEPVLDFYDGENDLGYRIAAKSFDFSCLGAKKTLLAGENFEILCAELKKNAPNAVFDQNYKTIRSLLNKIWKLEERRNSTGLQRAGVGKHNFANVLTVNNQTQFNRYSRLRAQWEKQKRQK